MTNPQDRVVAWLKRSGFPFEMRVAAAWERVGFAIAQSVYYLDPESSSAREADILAYKDHIAADAWLRVTFVVECKARQDAGWVLFPRLGGPIDASTRLRMLTAPVSASPYLSRIARRGDVKALAALQSRIPAYAMAQARPAKDKSEAGASDDDGKDHAYAATMAVSKAASHLLAGLSDSDDDSFELLWPVIMTESPLYEARLSGDDIEVKPVEEATLIWRHPTARGVLAIDVVNAGAMDAYIARVNQAVELLLFNTSEELGAAAQKRAARRAAAANAPTA